MVDCCFVFPYIWKCNLNTKRNCGKEKKIKSCPRIIKKHFVNCSIILTNIDSYVLIIIIIYYIADE